MDTDDAFFVTPQTRQPLIRRGRFLVARDGQARYPIILQTPILLPSSDASVWHRELVEMILWEHPDAIEAIYADVTQWRKDPNALYVQTIRDVVGGKPEILRAAERYATTDTGKWLPKKSANQTISHFAKKDFLKYGTASNGKRRTETVMTSNHKDAYTGYRAMIAACAPHQILELSTGAGTGTANIACVMPMDAKLYTVDIDFACLGNAAGIARYHDKAVLPVCANFWYLPFADASFDLVCTLNGLDESREIQRTLAEAARVLRPGGQFLVFSRKSAYMRQNRILADFGFNAAETEALLQTCRMYASAEDLIERCREYHLQLTETSAFSSDETLTWVISLFQKRI